MRNTIKGQQLTYVKTKARQMLPVEAKSFSLACTIVCFIEFYSKKRIFVLGYQPITEGTREPTVKSLY